MCDVCGLAFTHAHMYIYTYIHVIVHPGHDISNMGPSNAEARRSDVVKILLVEVAVEILLVEEWGPFAKGQIMVVLGEKSAMLLIGTHPLSMLA